MSESSSNKPPIHWQDLSESLGVETAVEIEHFFHGNARLPGALPINDDFPTLLSSAAREIAANSGSSADGDSGIASNEFKTLRKTSMVNDPEFLQPDAEQTDDDPPAEPITKPDAESVDELELNWDTPASSTADSEPIAADSSPPVESKPPKRARKTEPKKASEEKPKPATPSADAASWDSLADTLGIERPEPSVTRTAQSEETETTSGSPDSSRKKRRPAESKESGRPSKRERTQEKETQQEPAADKPEGAGKAAAFGAGLLESIANPEPAAHQVLDELFVSQEPTEETRIDESDVGRAGFDEMDSQMDSQMDDSPEPDEFDADEESSFDDPFEEVDEDYVEFEIEDLDPAARRGQRKPRTESRPDDKRDSESRRRPRRTANEESGGPGDDESEIEESDRPRRSRSRGRGRKPASDERPPKPVSTRDEKRPRKSRDVDEVDVDEVDDVDVDVDVDDEGQRIRKGDSTRKARNLPTWNETVDVIVQANMASRKKQPPRRRRGGGRSRRKD